MNHVSNSFAPFLVFGLGLQCKLRCRLAEPTVLTALAQAFVVAPPTYPDAGNAMDEDTENEPAPIKVLLDPKSGKQDKLEAAEIVVKQAYSECPNYDFLTKSLLEAPLPRLLKSCRLQPGVPVKPMLAKAQDSFQEILRRMAGLHFTMEYKYDGERAQVNKDDGLSCISWSACCLSHDDSLNAAYRSICSRTVHSRYLVVIRKILQGSTQILLLSSLKPSRKEPHHLSLIVR